jgi:outer membrane lipoprotein
VIVDARNLADRTQLEVLGYPLDDRNRPDRDAQPVGRFLAMHPGYLETADYKEGRLVTVVGTVTEARTGTVGEARYVYPVVNVTALKLWPTEQQEAAEPRFHFGIGVGITR